MKKIFIVLTLILLSFGLFAAKPVVAVWEIDNKTVGKNKLSQYDAELIADLMRDELVQSQEFTVMSKEEMESAIAQHVKKSHQLNKDKNYAIELGKQISARYVVTSWIKTDGNSFRMFAEITDTETATTTHSGRAKFVMDGDSKDIAIASLIRQLLGERDESLRPKKSDDQLACEQARSSSDPAGWIAYKKRYPNGICIEEAGKELDRSGCELARSQNTIEAWEKYLQRHNNGTCAFEAEEAIIRLKHPNRSSNTQTPSYDQPSGSSSRDAKACKYAQNENSLEAWQDYLDSFPDGECSFEAKGNIRKLKQHTNLQWSSKSPNTMSSNEALNYCKNLSEKGFNDWRLPNIDELRTLIQNHPGTVTGGSCKISERTKKLAWEDWTEDCEFRSGHNFSKLGDTGFFWSSSIRSFDRNGLWSVGFDSGEVLGVGILSAAYVRCVR